MFTVSETVRHGQHRHLVEASGETVEAALLALSQDPDTYLRSRAARQIIADDLLKTGSSEHGWGNYQLAILTLV